MSVDILKYNFLMCLVKSGRYTLDLSLEEYQIIGLSSNNAAIKLNISQEEVLINWLMDRGNQESPFENIE